MGLFGIDGGDWKNAGLAPFTGGTHLFPEDFRSKIPIHGDMWGAKSDEEKALVDKQKEMAEEARKRQRQQHQQSMNALGQRMLAFNPQNQMLARMFGPEAAFTPEQFANMSQDPATQAVDPELINYQGMDPAIQARVQEQIQTIEADKRRREMLMSGMQQPGPGPAPLQQRQPAPARKF